MKIKTTDNGNVTVQSKRELISQRNSNNRTWFASSDTESNLYQQTDNLQFNTNNSIYDYRENSESFVNSATTTEDDVVELKAELVCNRQYRLNSRKVNNIDPCNTSETSNLEGPTDTVCASSESFIGSNSNVYSDITPADEERAFEHSDTDEMSENGVHPVPRGIVNPNYPGFQHLAHTLQDYSSNIENFYHSENEMTDDDVDVEITELVYEPEPNQNGTIAEYKNINNNNINDDISNTKLLPIQNNSYAEKTVLDRQIQNEIPDLLKTLSRSNNNNVETVVYDLNCTDTDLEDNFHTKDIIGDFNKEIEDEIKQLLNYNINIQDDLEELRKDIKDTFAKPIENTINNISDVVNHVIKKLVETQVDGSSPEDSENKLNSLSLSKQGHFKEVSLENEKNTRTEMNRPTFLLLDNSNNDKIQDAFLSDGKDEININEYDPEKLSLNVENTIKQLSTELRKIIPKLEEMRECDRLWAKSRNDNVMTDGNSNEIANSSKGYPMIHNVNSEVEPDISKTTRHIDNHINIRSNILKSQSDSKPLRDRQKETSSKNNCCRNAQHSACTSVRKNDNAKDSDLNLGSFDVYNIETALPKLDLDAIENHLKAAKEAERRNLVNNIRRKLSKTSEEIRDSSNVETPEKSGFKRGLHLFKLKLFKSESGNLPVISCDDTALSPRALSSVDCALTEVEWPNITENNPNILDRFTRIISISDRGQYDKNKRNDREEIRKRLAMGADTDEYYSMGHSDRPGKKPSLHSRLQNGMNLQICFMNETASDNESQVSDIEKNYDNTKSLSRSSIFSKSNYNHPYQTRPLSVNITKNDKISTVQSGAKLRPTSLTFNKTSKSRSSHSLGHIEIKESDFYVLQATLQTEARIALAQAKEMARIQMERERRSRPVSPVTEMLRRSMEKANAPLAVDRRRVSRQLLTDMNIAQLQVIVNELHSQIESLNEALVKLLMARDELHMGQDSMLVDIEDLTRYLGVKEQTKKTKGTTKVGNGMRRLTSLVHK